MRYKIIKTGPNAETLKHTYDSMDGAVGHCNRLNNNESNTEYPWEVVKVPEIQDILNIAAKLISGLNDPKSAEKLLAERQELIDALTQNDKVGAYTEAADAVYYAVKHLDWVARQVSLSIDQILMVCFAKYELRAKPGNPKNDLKERLAVLSILNKFGEGE